MLCAPFLKLPATLRSDMIRLKYSSIPVFDPDSVSIPSVYFKKRDSLSSEERRSSDDSELLSPSSITSAKPIVIRIQQVEKTPQIPEEVSWKILCQVDDVTLCTICIYVCQDWSRILKSQKFWKYKCQSVGRVLPPPILGYRHKYRDIYFKNPYGRNLVQNPSGEAWLANWTVIENGRGGFCTESPVKGCSSQGFSICFATSTSNLPCIKLQVVDLIKAGIDPVVLDVLKPRIRVSEWHASHYECASQYYFRAFLGSTLKYPGIEIPEQLSNFAEWELAKDPEDQQYNLTNVPAQQVVTLDYSQTACGGSYVRKRKRRVPLCLGVERVKPDSCPQNPLNAKERIDLSVLGFEDPASDLVPIATREIRHDSWVFWFHRQYAERVLEGVRGGQWEETGCSFEEYPRGVREVIIRSGGIAIEMRRGYFGPRMARASIVVDFG